jgi:hypothetical protein
MPSTLLDQFQGLGFFAGWLAVALAIGFSLFYAWDLLYKRGESRRRQDGLRAKPDGDEPAASRTP